MAMHLLLPEFSHEDSTTKDKIISILAAEPSQTTRKIHHILKKQYSTDVTYQAVHKIVKQMVRTGVLREDSHNYTINQDWIKQLKTFIDKVQSQAHDGDTSKSDLKMAIASLYTDQKVHSFTFNSLEDVDAFYNELRKREMERIVSLPEADRIVCYHAQHYYGALLDPQKEYRYLKDLKRLQAKVYALCRGKTLLDNWVRDFYNQDAKSNYMLKTGVECAQSAEIWLFPNVLVEVYYSEKFLKIFNDLYARVKEIKDIKFDEVLEKMYANKETIQLIINKNKEILESVKKNTMVHFNSK